MSKLLVVVDYQNDFVNGALGFEQAAALEDPILNRVQAALNDGWKVIFTRDTHSEDYLNTREGQFLPVPHCIENTSGWHLYGKLAQYESESCPNVMFVNKPTFGSEELPHAACTLCGGEPEAIELCGVVTNICVVSNAILLHSAFLSSSVSILKDLCAAPNPEDHESTLRLLSGMGYGIV